MPIGQLPLDEHDRQSSHESGVRVTVVADPPSPKMPTSRFVRARRRGLEPQERRRVLAAVALRTNDGWRFQFALLQSLSVTVAVMGLSAGSAAVVIGAMLLAPLMVPVLGVAAAMAMAMPRHLGRSLVIVLLASLGSIALAYLLAMFLPAGPLSGEVLSRTSPDLRDLVVALAAGAAGAYATVRTDVSSSLPGVAVAVALVPPLSVVGITLEAGRRDLAEGAALLYAANLTAIILIGVLIFLLTGLVPPRRIRQARLHVSGGAILVAAMTAAVGAPLTLASVNAAEDGRRRERVDTLVAGWVQSAGDEVDEVRIDDDLVRIRISGPNPPTPTSDLERAVQQILGPAAVVEALWTQTQTPPAELVEEELDPEDVDTQARQETVRLAVDAWLGEPGLAGQGGVYDIDRLDVGATEMRLDLTSADPPPPVDALTERLRADAGLALSVVVNWTQRTTLRPGADGAEELGTIERVRRDLESVAVRWAFDTDEMAVTAVGYDGDRVTVELVGAEAVEVGELETLLLEVAPANTPIVVWFTQRQRLLPISTTNTTSPVGPTDE